MLERFFQLKLKSLGFEVEDMELSWSVGFCQGDYVSFTGRIGHDVLRHLIMHMHGLDVGPESEVYPRCSDELSEMLSVLENYGNCDLSFTASNCGRGVPHVYVETSDNFEAIFDYHYQSIIACYNDTISWDKNREWQRQWEAFQDWLTSKHESWCTDMLRQGHAILLAGCVEQEVVWERSTTNYIAQVVEGCDDLSGNINELDDEEAMCFFNELIEGRKRYGFFQVNIRDQSSRQMLGSSVGYSFISNTDVHDRELGQLHRMALKEAITDARGLIRRHQSIV